MAVQLVVIAGPDAGRAFPLKEGDPLLIGRGKNTATQLSDPRVSRVHCQVKIEKERVVVLDLGGAGGISVNGKAAEQQELVSGDVLQVGDTKLRFDDEDETDEDAPAGAARPSLLPAERMHELTGAQLGRYTLGPMLAKGQSGLVFLGRDTKQSRMAALKVFWPEFSRDAREVKRFIRAMKTMLPIRHAHLVTLYAAGLTTPYCWMAMEYVEGESVTQVIRRIGAGGALPWQDALRVGIHVCRALVFAHFHQIIHRNITPQNILIRGSDRVAKLGDMMTAKALEGSQAQQITKPGELLGDVQYMAPERTSGMAADVDQRSDLYSLGATVYALLTGRPPLQGSSLVETILKIRQEQPVGPKRHRPDMPAGLDVIVLKLLAKPPEQRYQTAGQLLGDLDQLAKAHKVNV
jgi:serine/threonine protein kinase